MEKKENYTIELNDERGEIIISDEVIAVIAGLAAIEVDGVASMAGDIAKDLIGKLGKKATSKGVKVDVLENVAKVVVSLNIKYGYNVMEVSEKVQDKVKVAVENMTGLTVSDVNIRVAGVAVEE